MRRAVKIALFILLAGVLLPGAQSSYGQIPDPLMARIEEADSVTSLDSANLKPWHLKLAVQQLDVKGNVKEQGTVEEFWAAPDKWKVVYDFPSFKGSELLLDSGSYPQNEVGDRPAAVDGLLAQIVHPMTNKDMQDAKPDLRKTKFGKVELDCIMLDQHLVNVAFPPLGLFPTYCLDQGKATLRITYDVGSSVYLRNGIGHFQGRDVATSVTVDEDGQRTAAAQVVSLTGMKIEDADFAPPPGTQPVGERTARIPAGVMAGNIIYKKPPVYPIAAKEKHITGTVRLHAIIGRDGQIRALRLLGAPDSQLAIAAIAAVKEWRYKPYLLNGRPTEVETSIAVNFLMSPS